MKTEMSLTTLGNLTANNESQKGFKAEGEPAGASCNATQIAIIINNECVENGMTLTMKRGSAWAAPPRGPERPTNAPATKASP